MDPYCYSREGARCEGHLGRGCIHCGRIITIQLMEEQKGTEMLIGQMLQKAGLKFLEARGRHMKGKIHLDEVVVPTEEDKKLVEAWAEKEGYPATVRVANEEELRRAKERENEW